MKMRKTKLHCPGGERRCDPFADSAERRRVQGKDASRPKKVSRSWRTASLTAFLSMIMVCIAFACTPMCVAQSQKRPALDVHLVTDEAEAVLAILEKRKTNQPITEADWRRLFMSEGYVRLKQRELAMQNPFEDAEVERFVLSEDLAQRAQALAHTLDKWRRSDLTRSGRLAHAYLPKGARIRAKIYPVIKPRENSFVFDVKRDPAIFLFIDPLVTRAKFENTLAHELHHIGLSTSCPSAQAVDALSKLPPQPQTVLKWIGAFGEGFAMLAAAGGPNVDPHAVSPAAERSRWDKDLLNQ